MEQSTVIGISISKRAAPRHLSPESANADFKKSRRVLPQDDRSETYVVSSSTFQNHPVSGQFRFANKRATSL